MKKVITLFVFLTSTLVCLSQYYEEINIDAIVNGKINLCADDENLLGVIIRGELDCPDQRWHYGIPLYEVIYADSIVVFNNHEEQCIGIVYIGCSITATEFWVTFAHELEYEQPTNDPIIWKKPEESVGLWCPDWGPTPCWGSWGAQSYLWSTGENGDYITVTMSGIYSVTFNHPCTPATYSVEVRDNVEAYRATVDLRTNKNKVTWQVTPEQAEYITDVKVYRDGVLIGTTPYTNGYFLDAIGSDAAARNYHIVGVAIEGDDCPIPSYEKGTIHTTYYEDVDGNLNMTWNTPYIEEGAQGTLTGYQICKYNPATEEVTVVDQVNASITDYTCNTAAFTGGQATIAAIFDSKDVEDRAFSNLTDHTFAVSEENETNFMVYPNPSNGTFIVEGNGLLSIRNVLGQEIMTKEIEDKINLELPKGIYFLKMNGRMQKVVVE